MGAATWFGFVCLILVLLGIDLLFHRRDAEIRLRSAALWTTFWIALGMLFYVGVHFVMGRQAGLEYLTGYLLEKSLSVDNMFVFALIFAYFGVPGRYQHKILFWGIIGALVTRGAMIGAGYLLVERFHWILYVFGAFLVFTGIRMAVRQSQVVDLEANWVMRLVTRFLPVTSGFRGGRFLVRVDDPRRGSRLLATPLLLVLLMVEATDVAFALDSIPAIFAVTDDPFIIFTSNVFAILGLRSLYFLLAGVMDRFHYLRIGLALILIFIGAKMLLEDVYEIPVAYSLVVVAVGVAASIGASLLWPKPGDPDLLDAAPDAQPDAGPQDRADTQPDTRAQGRADVQPDVRNA